MWPLNATQMHLSWPNAPATGAFLQTGSTFESDPAYNPTTGLVYVAAFNSPGWHQSAPIKGPGIPYSAGGNAVGVSGPTQKKNTTIYGLDAGTGKIVWSYYYPNVSERGGVATTSDLVIVARNDGFIDFLNAKTGKLVFEKFIGAPMISTPAVATDASGNMAIVLPGTSGTAGAGVFQQGPGFMFALAVGSTSTGQIVTSGGGTITVTSTQTITQALSTITQSTPTGIDSSTFYAVAGLAAIFVIATGVLVLRRSKTGA